MNFLSMHVLPLGRCIETGYPGEGVKSPSLEVFKDMQKWCLGTWFSSGLGSAGLIVGLSDMKGLFQTK